MDSAQAPLLHALTLAAYTLHVGAGFVGLVSGFIAAFARKGGKLHRSAGTIFFAAMLVMAIFAAYLAVVVPDQLVNVYIAAFTSYLLVTGWLAARRSAQGRGVSDVLSMLAGALLLAPFAILSFQLATGAPPLFKSAVPFEGPVLIAIYAFTAILTIATLGDARVLVFGAITGVPRISRHLWRTCLGLTLATGSAFTNGFARLLPGPYHVPAWFFYPQFIPLLLLVFWMIRVRFKGWLARAPLKQPT